MSVDDASVGFQLRREEPLLIPEPGGSDIVDATTELVNSRDPSKKTGRRRD